MIQSIDSFLQSRLDDYIAETARLCAQPSVSATGYGVAECADLVGRTLEQHGFSVQKFSTAGQPVIVGHADGKSQRTILFYNHYDVQPPEPLDLWTTPPFEPTVRDGALYARGAKDDKGEFVARLAAVDAARAANGGELPGGVTFVVEGEEEIASPHIADFVLAHTNLLKCDGAVWEEGGIDLQGHPGSFIGVRGIIYVQLEVETLKLDAHSGSAHYLPNAAWRLIRALTTLKGPDERILIPGFYDQAIPPSALDIDLLKTLYDPADEPWLRENFGVKTFVAGATGVELESRVFEPTCNIAGFLSGYTSEGSKTVIPARAMAKVDFRLIPDQDPDDIFARLRAHLDAQGFDDVQVTRLGQMWPYKASADDPFIQLAVRTAAEVYDQPMRLVPMTGGSSPVYAFARPLGNIPVIAPGVGYWNNKTHSPDEHVRLVDFLNAGRHLARIVNEFASIT